MANEPERFALDDDDACSDRTKDVSVRVSDDGDADEYGDAEVVGDAGQHVTGWCLYNAFILTGRAPGYESCVNIREASQIIAGSLGRNPLPLY